MGHGAGRHFKVAAAVGAVQHTPLLRRDPGQVQGVVLDALAPFPVPKPQFDGHQAALTPRPVQQAEITAIVDGMERHHVGAPGRAADQQHGRLQ